MQGELLKRELHAFEGTRAHLVPIGGSQQRRAEVLNDLDVAVALDFDLSFEGVENRAQVAGSLKAEPLYCSLEGHDVLDRPNVVRGPCGFCEVGCAQQFFVHG